MPRIRTLVIVGVAGAALSYFLDPEEGEARRARLQDGLAGVLRRGRRELETAAGQLQDRVRGTHRPAALAPPPEDDLTVLSRVESVLFALPDFPRGAIELEVAGGRLVLRGETSDDDQAREIAEAASRVRGVGEVENLLLPATLAEARPRTASRRPRSAG